jgi:tetratricopeptide (TPR) repeat protein
VQAAENATSRAAHRQAAALFTEALEIAKRLRQDERIVDLRARRGKAHYNTEQWIEARHDLEFAADRLGRDHSTRRADVLVDLAMTCNYVNDGAGLKRYSAEAMAVSQGAGGDLTARALCARAFFESSEARLHQAIDYCSRALAQDEGFQVPAELLGRMLYWMGRPEDAIVRSRQAVQWCQSVGRSTTAVHAMGDLGLALVAVGRYAEAVQVFEDAKQLSREFELAGAGARAIIMRGGGLHLHLFDFVTAQKLAEEARDKILSGDSVRGFGPIVSAGIDLLFNFARRGEVALAQELLKETAGAVQGASGAHGWLWQSRFEQAQAELALACGRWEEALCHAHLVIEQSRATCRVKYEIAGLQARAAALISLGRKHDAIADLQTAVRLARGMGDPAIFLRAAAALLQLDGSDALADEARQAVQRITAALPDDSMRRAFEAAEPVRILTKL